jgi:antitoxin component of MazEF toxin-antitoxin module
MEATVIKIGSSLGFKLPEAMVRDFNLNIGTIIQMDFKQDGNLILQKKSKVREGWDTAFAQYAIEGEDKFMLPDFMDSEADELL